MHSRPHFQHAGVRLRWLGRAIRVTGRWLPASRPVPRAQPCLPLPSWSWREQLPAGGSVSNHAIVVSPRDSETTESPHVPWSLPRICCILFFVFQPQANFQSEGGWVRMRGGDGASSTQTQQDPLPDESAAPNVQPRRGARSAEGRGGRGPSF